MEQHKISVVDKTMTDKTIEELICGKLHRYFGCRPLEATRQQMYKAVAMAVQHILAERRHATTKAFEQKGEKQVYYLSVEFLPGRSLRNNLSNMGLNQIFDRVIQKIGFNLEDLYGFEPDAGLGNGGLGRLASCYMDSLTTLSMPVQGFSIRYEFGIFRQKIVDGWQTEEPDNWLDNGEVWLIPRMDEAVEVRFGGRFNEYWQEDRMWVDHEDYQAVLAIPYDMLISGYDTSVVNTLRLWGAKSVNRIDMAMFSRGEHIRALEQSAAAEAITKVLYPADDHYPGKTLRLKQQYFLVSASVQNIVTHHLRRYGSLATLPDKTVIHINDTHPTLVIPELMRICLDEHGLSWDESWRIVTRTVAYTNHTVMSEALESWPIPLFNEQLPRIFAIIQEINRRFCEKLYHHFPGDHEKVGRMAIIGPGDIRMANLCVAACYSVNGVSKLHSEILQETIFKEFFSIMPEKFTNVTNGIAHRRWLCQANPDLSDMLDELIGPNYRTKPDELSGLASFADDQSVQQRLEDIKLKNKERLANYISEHCGVRINPKSIFDVQVKRLHEYKRQMLNVLHILQLYHWILEHPEADLFPRTFIFAAKASPGYHMAKQTIRLISCVAQMVNNNPRVNEKLKVVFLEDYRVTLAEKIIPAAEISEQISLAGKEASGTGNMKLMINGAITMGTLDGANIEILDAVGPENIFIFGMTAQEVEDLWRKGYNPSLYYYGDLDLKRVIDHIASGVDGVDFSDVVASLLKGHGSHPDAYMCLADFRSYIIAQQKAADAYSDRSNWNRMALLNIAGAGRFAADRSIRDYVRGIWKIRSLTEEI